MKTLKYVLVIAIASISFISCSEDRLSLITDKTWVLESVNMAGMDMSQAQIQSDEGGEYKMKLNSDGTVLFTDSMGMNPVHGSWVFQQNDTQFVVSGIEAGMSDVNTITRLTDKELWFWHMDGTDKMIMHYKVK